MGAPDGTNSHQSVFLLSCRRLRLRRGGYASPAFAPFWKPAVPPSCHPLTSTSCPSRCVTHRHLWQLNSHETSWNFQGMTPALHPWPGRQPVTSQVAWHVTSTGELWMAMCGQIMTCAYCLCNRRRSVLSQPAESAKQLFIDRQRAVQSFRVCRSAGLSAAGLAVTTGASSSVRQQQRCGPPDTAAPVPAAGVLCSGASISQRRLGGSARGP